MDFNFTTLGTASALPTKGRYPSAHVLNIRGRLFLIDCGEGTQMLLFKYGFSILKIDNIFLSHLHGDHCFGIFGLLSSMGMKGRTSKLTIHAPAAFKGILDMFLYHFEGDAIKYEIVHNVLEGSVRGELNKIFESRNIEGYSFPLNHRVPTYGFLFREKMPPLNVVKSKIEEYHLTLKEIALLKSGQDVDRGDEGMLRAEEFTYKPFKPRSFAYCSDTAPFKELVNVVAGVDLLYHEATFAKDLEATAKTTFHSTATDAALLAKDAGVKGLVIGHYSSRYSSVDHLKEEAQAIFENVYLASKGEKFEVPLERLSK